MNTWPLWLDWYLFIALVVGVALLFVEAPAPGLVPQLSRLLLAALTWPVLLALLLRKISRSRRAERRRWEVAQASRGKPKHR